MMTCIKQGVFHPTGLEIPDRKISGGNNNSMDRGQLQVATANQTFIWGCLDTYAQDTEYSTGMAKT